jgi:hypothetical protein
MADPCTRRSENERPIQDVSGAGSQLDTFAATVERPSIRAASRSINRHRPGAVAAMNEACSHAAAARVGVRVGGIEGGSGNAGGLANHVGMVQGSCGVIIVIA